MSRVRQTGVMALFDVFGNVILLTPKENADRISELWVRRSIWNGALRQARAVCPTRPD